MSNRNGNVIRKHKSSNFTLVDNDIMKNKSMSLKGKGLLVLLLSLPDDWSFSEAGLTALSKDGRDSLRSGLKELEDFGFLHRTQENTGGKFGRTVYNIYETPLLEKPMSGKPLLEKPMSENPTAYKELNNKVLNNKELNNTIMSTSSIPYKEIIEHLNEKADKNFNFKASGNRELIKARWNEDYTLDDFIKVIDIKSSHWLENEKMNDYLRPETLFRKSNFDKYLNQSPKPEQHPSMPIYKEEEDISEESRKKIMQDLEAMLKE